MNHILPQLQALLVPALLDRLVLVINHVLGREPQAVARLLPHQGKVLRLELLNQPSLLPQVPALAFAVTPAGLLEVCPEGAEAALLVRLDAANPAALALSTLAGNPLPVTVDGDAQLAGDVDWLLKNLRWDVADDLQRLFGPVVAQQLHGMGGLLSRSLRGALQGAADLAGRFRAR